MTMPLYFIYLSYTSVLAIIMVVVVPRRDIHRLALAGIFYGGIVDIFWILLIGLVGAGGYLNYGPLGVKSMPFLPPVSWTFFFMLYLYFLPNRRPWNYLFAVVAAGYSLFFSHVLSNLGIFHWTFSKVLFPAGVYSSWMLFVTWSYERYGDKFVHSVVMNKAAPKSGCRFYIKSRKQDNNTNSSIRRLKKPTKIR